MSCGPNCPGTETCGCCEILPERPVSNRAGLSEIKRRVGTYSTFKPHILRSVDDEANRLLIDHGESVRSSPGSAQSPIFRWTARTSDDIGIALTETAAMALDVLTFYQERISNEAYIRTAKEDDSITGLVAALNYTPAPAISAETYLAFDVEPDREVTVEAWSQVQSVPVDGEPPQVFETVETFRAKGILNAVQPLPSSQSVAGVTTSIVRVPASARGFAAGTDVFIGPGYGAVRRKVERVTETPDSLELTLSEDVTPDRYTRIWPERTVANSYGTGLPGRVDGPTVFIRETSIEAGFIYLDRVVDEAGLDFVALRAGSGHLIFKVDAIATASRGAGPLERTVSKIAISTDFRPLFEPGDRAWFLGPSSELVLTRPAAELGSSATLQVPDGVAEAFEIDRPVVVTDKDGSHLASVSAIDEIAGTVQLQPPLPRAFDLASTRIRGNVVLARHGERVANETIGDGDPTLPTQDLGLTRFPLAWRLDGSSPIGRSPEVEVFADGLQWSWNPGSTGTTEDPRFLLRGVDDEQQVSIGDVAEGRRAPRGIRNITATYRVGGGIEGNVGPNTLRAALDRPPAFRNVTNPLPAEDGTDAEGPEHMRAAAPRSLRNFGRIISLDDFAQAAITFSGVAKAFATWTWANGIQVVHLTVAGDSGRELSDDHLDELRLFLDRQRDDRRPLTVQNYVPVPVDIKLDITADARVVVDTFENTILEVLREATAFERLRFGRPLFASALTTALHAEPSVLGVRWRRFSRKGGGTKSSRRAGIRPRPLHWGLGPADPMPVVGVRGATPAGAYANRPAELPAVEIDRRDLRIILEKAPETIR